MPRWAWPQFFTQLAFASPYLCSPLHALLSGATNDAHFSPAQMFCFALLWDLRISHGVCVFMCVCVLVAQSCPTLWDPMDYSLPGSPVHGILQARILEWVAISCSRGSSQPRDLLNWQVESLPLSHLGSSKGENFHVGKKMQFNFNSQRREKPRVLGGPRGPCVL